MGMIGKYGNQLGTAGQDVYWRSILPGYEGQDSSFAIPGYNNEFTGAMRPNWGAASHDMRGPDYAFGAAKGDRHLMSNMTKGLGEEDAYRVASMIDSGAVDHLNYGSAQQEAHSLYSQGWDGPGWEARMKKKKEKEEPVRPFGSKGMGGGFTGPQIPRMPSVMMDDKYRPWSPYPDEVL